MSISNNDKHPKDSSNSHAIIIGGSMAGLLSARVLTDYFDTVTLLERDGHSDLPAFRPGLPQAQHVHALLKRGQGVLEGFFPGLHEEMVALGAHVLDSAADLKWLTPGGWGVRFRSGIDVLSFSRPLIDWVLRRRLAANPQIRILDNRDVSGLTISTGLSTITGVTTRKRGVASLGEETIEADLVVDAMGRGSRTPQWLSQFGYLPPQETVVNAFIGYASRIYKRPSNFNDDWKAFILQAAPPHRSRAGLIFPIEGDRWLITITGGSRDYPPADEQGFLDFIRSLPSTEMIRAVQNAEPLSDIKVYRANENRWRHYERTQLPNRFLVTGDAACAFNPIYGQGMTTAALGALLLQEQLEDQLRSYRSLDELGPRYQKALARLINVPWTIATGTDYRYPVFEGGQPTLRYRFMHKYIDHVLAIAATNRKIRSLWLQVFQMVKPPQTMFRPSIAMRVLGRVLRGASHTQHPQKF